MASILRDTSPIPRKRSAQAVENAQDVSANDLCLPLRERIIYERLRDLHALGRDNMIREVANDTRLPTAEVGDATARLAVAGLTALACLRMAVEGVLSDSLEDSYRTFREILGRAA